ncbi:MAG: DNA-3-methyladenine glycosylase I [Alphaproteobacteria bacterium]|nr:DNA-3-methyladenine glycosylase I [Alphaproteobacteria bacterium]
MPAGFAELFEIASRRKGGTEALVALLPTPTPTEQLAAMPDDRWLAEMAKRVFQAGFNWQVVENKWPGFEEAFSGFDVHRNAMMNDEDLDRLVSDTRIVRNGAKIRSVRDNAVFCLDLAKEYGSVGRCIADWSPSDHIGLLELLKTRGARLGGLTGMMVLRGPGKDGFMLGGDVLKALIREGVIDKEPTAKAAQKAVQEAFNAWVAESGRPYMQVSRVLAYTVE